MGWFNRKPDVSLVGRWDADPEDAATIEAFGQVSMEFDDDGRLNYIISEEGKVQAILMTYEVVGNKLITDQPSHPNPQTTQFKLVDDKLTLTFGGETGRFVRIT